MTIDLMVHVNMQTDTVNQQSHTLQHFFIKIQNSKGARQQSYIGKPIQKRFK
jgi:hypothetical protein